MLCKGCLQEVNAIVWNIFPESCKGFAVTSRFSHPVESTKELRSH